MKINIRYIKEKDIFEFQLVEKKLRSHFIMARAELNDLRTLLERALLESKKNRSQGK